MFNHGFFEWAHQVESHQEVLLHELGIDLSELDGHISTLHIWWARRPLAAIPSVCYNIRAETPKLHSC